jgi:hypothetical protein
MNTQFDYRHYQARRAEDLRKSEQNRLAQQANTEAFYSPALAQFGRSLVMLGRRLQEQAESRPQPTKAYR